MERYYGAGMGLRGNCCEGRKRKECGKKKHYGAGMDLSGNCLKKSIVGTSSGNCCDWRKSIGVLLNTRQLMWIL